MKKTLLLTASATALSAQAAVADFAGNTGGYYGHMGGAGYGFGFMGIGMMVLFWGVVVLLVLYAIRSLVDPDKKGSANSAINILRDRLAKGEIDAEEFEVRRKALEV